MVRPLLTKKILKPKQLMMNTSTATLPNLQDVKNVTYMIQQQNATVNDVDMNDFDEEQYVREHLAFELKHDFTRIDYFGFS